MSCRLIVTADDFGLCPEVNEAVYRGCREGVLTSASLMVNGFAAEHAVSLAKKAPRLAVGLHLVIPPASGFVSKSDLTAPSDRIASSPASFLVRCSLSRAARDDLRRAIRAQFEQFAATGLPLSHVDGHQHFHVHPAIFPYVLSLAQEFGAAGIRIPQDPIALRELFRSWRVERLAWWSAFRLVRRFCTRRIASTSLKSAAPTLGLMDTGSMDERRVVTLLEQVKGPLVELYLHPTVGRRMHRLGPNPDDFRALLSPAVRRVIERRRFQLCSYRGLEEHSPRKEQ